ncbi:hypothetical protein [Flavobacterium weaverense]|uniref:hypothetical protein n=1 Tax=Flavobacterium weaverense TaxID=271156 RepID=UPI000EFA07F2|nr:hypothetical protein [Flavobacterium weaverense]
MSDVKLNSNNAEEPITAYKTNSKQKGIGENFDFDKEFKNGYKPEELLLEMKKRISKYHWKK